MADEEEAEKEAAPAGSRKLLWIALTSVALLGAAAAATFVAMSRQPTGEEAEAAADAPPEEADSGTSGDQRSAGPVIHALEPMIVNIFDGERDRFLKIHVNFEVSSPEVSKELDDRTAQVKDMMISLISSQAYADIRSLEGKAALREQLMTRMNALVTRGVVRQVFFTDFVVQ
jgi:flagellar FliL protein